MPLDLLKQADGLSSYSYVQSSHNTLGGMDFKQRERYAVEGWHADFADHADSCFPTNEHK